MFSSNTSAVSGDANYIEDVFSTWLYTGNGSTQTINNGIDLSGKGGLVWVKPRSASGSHLLRDTARGGNKLLTTDTTDAESTTDSYPTGNGLQFNNNGFSLGPGGAQNFNNFTFVSWTFRKQPKFFDVVTYTGNGSGGQTISHSLTSRPGAIFVKRTDSTSNWFVWVRDSNSTGTTGFSLNSTNAAVFTSYGNSTLVTAQTWRTDQVLDLSGNQANINGATYVAYLFAHNAGGFGLTGTDNVISCGSFTTNSSGFSEVSLGYEPQYILFKRTSAPQNWYVWDTMRGMALASNVSLSPNLSDAELNWGATSYVYPTATGFAGSGNFFGTGVNVIYIAIRRGPMKTPTSGTSVFGANLRSAQTLNGTDVTAPAALPNAGDWFWLYNRGTLNDTTSYPATWARLIGGNALSPQNTNAETGSVLNYGFGQNTIRFTSTWDGSAKDYVQYFMRRAPGFFDVVCYTGNDQVNRAINHNLLTSPELIILKSRFISGWFVYSTLLQSGRGLMLNETGGQLDYSTNFAPNLNSATQFGIAPSAGTAGNVNVSGINYVAYLFASCPGVSKVGSYTGNGSSQTLDMGFTGGARFFLVKRTDSTGDWWVYDSARGIVAAADPALRLNSTAAEVTSADAVDTASVGLIVNQESTCNINVNGATYVYLGIA